MISCRSLGTKGKECATCFDRGLLGRKDCLTSQKNVCEGGYLLIFLLVLVDMYNSLDDLNHRISTEECYLALLTNFLHFFLSMNCSIFYLFVLIRLMANSKVNVFQFPVALQLRGKATASESQKSWVITWILSWRLSLHIRFLSTQYSLPNTIVAFHRLGTNSSIEWNHWQLFIFL